MFKKVDQFAQISPLKNVKTLQYLYESLHTRSFKQLLDKAIAYIKIYSFQAISSMKKQLKLVSAVFKRQIYFFVISNEVQWKEI